ncbi:MAG: hypothetical protein GTO14_07715 [Anaerolineales bacterium]|nr:hypothetical protein [Anaerolineales bacterium]
MNLTEGRDEQVVGLLMKVRRILDTPVEELNQILLLLSAATQHMKRVERIVLDGMRLDRWISLNEEAVLVRIRLICAEVIALLVSESEELRPAPVRVRY